MYVGTQCVIRVAKYVGILTMIFLNIVFCHLQSYLTQILCGKIFQEFLKYCKARTTLFF